MRTPSPAKGLLAAAGWSVFGGAALTLLMPHHAAYRTAVAALGALLFLLALAAPRAAFGVALLASTGLGVSSFLFGLLEPVAALPAALAGYLAGAALRDIYELEASPPPPMLPALRAFTAASAVSAVAAIAAARTAYLLARGVPPPRVVNGIGMEADAALLGSLTAVAALVLMAGFHRAAARLSRDVRGRRAVDAALVLAALLPGAVALAQRVGLLPLWRAGRWEEWRRVQATFTDPSSAGIAIVLLLPTLLARCGRGQPFLRLAAAAGAVLLLPLLADTGSRAGFLGTLLAAGLFLVWTLTRLAAGERPGPRRRLAVTLGAVTFLAVGAFLSSVLLRGTDAGPAALVARLSRTFSRASTPSEGETGRLVLYETGLALFRDHPVAGIGLGAFRVRFPDAARALGRDVRWTDNPPSLYLGTLVESGLAGGMLLAILVAALIRGVLAALSFRESASEEALRGAAAAASVVGLLFVFLFGSHLVYPEIAVLAGVVAARLPFPADGKTRRVLVALVPVALAGALVLLLGGIAARLFESRGPDAAFAFDSAAGVHAREREPDGRVFRWTAPTFALRAGADGRRGVLRLPVRNGRADREPVTLRVLWNDRLVGRVVLPADRWRVLELPAEGRGVLRVAVAPPYHAARDPRPLGIEIGEAVAVP